MFLFKQQKNRGFSLLELTLAVAIFSLGSYAIATTIIDATISTKIATEKTEALFYAQEGIGAVRSIRAEDYANLVNDDYGLDNSGGTWAFSGSSDTILSKYTRVVTVSDVTDAKKIVVTITWDITPAREGSVTLATFLSDW